ncbi:M56 family metallopeptidase [Streptomyces sp. NRRL B-24484]|uniref:M56 family metallopeptidase n=1 Tax=Streptomyces sp. NRRL B-24484 TaxID=1463833 RepID=UPI0004BF7A48|nr:M56 family metallopeptidase [Streptomyces sp. NRRL B-24484]
MTVLLLLLALLAVTGWLAPRQLARSAWAPRAPRAAITTWAALILACAADVVMLAHRLSTTDHHGRGPFGWLLPADLRGPGESAGHVQAFWMGMAILAALSGVVLTAWVRGARARRRHRRKLDLVARRHEDGWLVMASDEPAAWCVAGDGGRIVLTEGALRMSPAHRDAVLAHECAHLAGRHHLITSAATALARGLRRLPAARLAGQAVPALVEMAADDRALRSTTPRVLAEALFLFATARTRPSSLGAGDHAVVARVRRLLDPAPLPRAVRTAWWIAAVVLPAAPVLLACGP